MSNISYTAPVLALLMSLPAAADDSKNSIPTARQMAHCMMARVKASPSENYKTAFKVCREQFESAANETQPVNARNNVDAADTPRN